MRTVASLVVLGSLLVACGSAGFDPGTGDAGPSNPGVGGGGGQDAGADATDAGVPEIDAALPPQCDGDKLPTDDTCVVSEAAGVFVSSSLGSSSGNGSRQHPLASLGAAIQLAKSQSKRVYACAETYPEAITLADGVSVFGYFDCNNGWTVGSSHAKVQSPTSPAATASGIGTPTRVEAVDIVAPNFTTGSQTSIGLLAKSSPALHMIHGVVHAGTGGKGADGANGIQLTDSGSAKDGQDGAGYEACVGTVLEIALCETAHNTRAGGTNQCNGEAGHDPGPGGSGGTGGKYDIALGWESLDPKPSNGGLPAATPQTAAGGIINGVLPQAGKQGASGSNGVSGSSMGALSSTGYTPSNGTSGTAGKPGQGGGGGAGIGLDQLTANDPQNQAYWPSTFAQAHGGSVKAWGTSGGGGGAGGCPGLPGGAGRGGGASIAVLATDSPMTLEDVNIESSTGGAAGKAGVFSMARVGGDGGSSPYESGASGGAGGYAGVSGNGGGGPSLGIVYHGAAVQLLASTVTPGAGGAGVAQRIINTFTIPASPTGKSADLYSF